MGLMPILLHLKKLLGQSQLRVESLPRQHALRALLDRHHSKGAEPHPMAIACLTAKQNLRLKSPIQDINHCLNQVHPAFNTLNPELRPGFCIMDLFPNHISFFPVKYMDDTARRNQISKLNNLMHAVAGQTQTILVVTDASVKKGHQAISIAHGWHNQMLAFNSEYAAINVTPAEAETFAIRDGINQTTAIEGVNHIIVITDSIQCVQ